MNFKFTWKNTALFLLALATGATVSVLLDNSLVGLVIIIAACYAIANQKPTK